MTRKEEREQAARKYINCNTVAPESMLLAYGDFIEGAMWADATAWKQANGDDLPEINKKVIALIEAFGHYKVTFAHRVDVNTEVHTSIDSKPFVLHPMRYDKGGWNIPDVKWWLDLELP